MIYIKQKIKEHLLRLSPEDRYCRFGTAVNDSFIETYVDKLKPEDNLFYSLDHSGNVVAFCHLAKYSDDSADLGITVDVTHRKRGYAKNLFDRAYLAARVMKIKKLYVYFLSDNEAMGKIARSRRLDVYPYAEQTRAEVQVPVSTIFDLQGHVVSEFIVLMDNHYKTLWRNY